jgi:hypothetical protein
VIYNLCFGVAGQIKIRCEQCRQSRGHGSLAFLPNCDDAFASPSILPISRAQTLNRDPKHSADFVELLGMAGLGQVEFRTITRADLDLEAGRFGYELSLAGMPLRFKSEASTVQGDAPSRSATTPNKGRAHAQFHGHLQLKPLKESDRLEE